MVLHATWEGAVIPCGQSSILFFEIVIVMAWARPPVLTLPSPEISKDGVIGIFVPSERNELEAHLRRP